MMDRREFLTLTSKLAASATIPVSLYGCGGGSSSTASLTSGASTSSVDQKVTEINAQQATIDSTNTDLNNALTSDLVETNPEAGNSLIRNTSIEKKTIAQFLATRTPNSYLGLDQKFYTPYPQPHYLDKDSSLSGVEFWQKALKSHERSYLDYQQQTAKLLATLRLFDAKNSEYLENSPEQNRNVLPRAATENIDSDASELLQEISDFSFDTSILNSNLVVSGLTTVIVKATTYLLNTNFIQALLDAILGLISNALDSIKTTSLEDLNFESRESILLSFAKMSVASAAVLGIKSVNELDSSNESNDNEFVSTYISSTDVLNKLTLKWLSFAQSLVNQTVKASTDELDSYTEQQENFSPTDLGNELSTNSGLMAMTSYAIKSVYNNFAEQALSSTETANGFTGSTATAFKPLFTNQTNEYDELVLDNPLNLENRQASIQQLGYEESPITIRTTSPEAERSDSCSQDSIYCFAQELAEVGTQVTSQGIVDTSASFAEQLAKYAFDFTMDIEDDAYNFAMQGMEYGYLFASQGEEVGVMADRILWMAVQIGVMADRIGEMADRIVYVSQLIVYTEILIVDFGILIYGVIKQISNSMLMALALILDREWYGDVAIEQASAEDAVLNTIGANVSQMLDNMNEYSEAVLENQKALRESTQDAINTIDFASSIEA